MKTLLLIRIKDWPVDRVESVTDWAIRITDWGLFSDWVSSHARLADPIRPIPNKSKSRHSGLSIALISRLPDWVVQSVLPIAIHRLLHRLYPLARHRVEDRKALSLFLKSSKGKSGLKVNELVH